MTREVAIKAIQDFIGWFKEDSLIRKAFEMAIQTLSQEPCEVIEEDKDHIWYKGKQYISLHRFLEIKIKPKIGHWIPIPYEIDYGSDAECSLCHGRFIDAMDYDYCPYCGAKMEKPQESEDEE